MHDITELMDIAAQSAFNEAARQHLAEQSEITEPAAGLTSPDSLKRGDDAQPEGSIVAGSVIPVMSTYYKDASELINIYLHHVPGDKAFSAFKDALEKRDAAIRQQARNEALEEAAKFIETHNMDNNQKMFSIKHDFDAKQSAYANAIRALKESVR